MQTTSIEAEIRGFLSKDLMLEFDGKVTPETDLFDAGLIDSYGFVDLVGFIERTFEIALTDDDLASPDMATLAGMVRTVTTRREAR